MAREVDDNTDIDNDHDDDERGNEDDGRRRVLAIWSGCYALLSFAIVAEVFLTGASVTAAGKNVELKLNYLALCLDAISKKGNTENQSENQDDAGNLNRLKQQVEARPAAFRPHGVVINFGAAVALVDTAATVILVVIADFVFKGSITTGGLYE